MVTINIKGMSCQHCVNSTKEALEKLPGIKDVQVSLEKGEANYDGDVDPDAAKEVIEKIGFEVV